MHDNKVAADGTGVTADRKLEEPIKVALAIVKAHFLALMLAAFRLVFVAAALPESHIQPTWGTSNSASIKGASVRRLPALMQTLGALKPLRHSWECQQVGCKPCCLQTEGSVRTRTRIPAWWNKLQQADMLCDEC